MVGRSKKSVFKFLADRIWKRIKGWNTKLGKVVLIKNVASTIPSYCMSCFLIPKTFSQKLSLCDSHQQNTLAVMGEYEYDKSKGEGGFRFSQFAWF